MKTIVWRVLLCGLLQGCSLIHPFDDGKDSDGKSLDLSLQLSQDLSATVGAVTTSSIGPAGGELTSADGKMLVRLPPDALSATTEISISSTSDKPYSGYAQLTPTYEIGPTGTVFKAPIAIEFTVQPALLDGIAHALGVTTKNNGEIETLPTVVDVPAGKILALATHLSPFAVTAPLDLNNKPGAKLCDCRQGNCFANCCPGNYSYQLDTCTCIYDYAKIWQQWDCYNACAGDAAPSKTSRCTPCVADCYRKQGGYVSRATPTECTGVLGGNGDLAAFQVCYANCHASGLDVPTSQCLAPSGDADGGIPVSQDGGPPAACGAFSCTLHLSGAVNETLPCSGHIEVFNDTTTNQLESLVFIANVPLSQNDLRSFNGIVYKYDPLSVGSNMMRGSMFYSVDSINQYGQRVLGPSSGTYDPELSVSCVDGVFAYAQYYDASGASAGTLTGDQGTISYSIEFTFTKQ